MEHDFSPYWNPVFIETGSFMGDGIKSAIKAGFEEIHSIELSKKYYNHCKKKYPNVRLYRGDSALILPCLLKTIDDCCTFWLDAHYSGGDTAKENPLPLIAELEAILHYMRPHHIILIDDIDLIREHRNEFKDFPYTLKDVEDILSLYNITYKDNILIAR